MMIVLAKVILAALVFIVTESPGDNVSGQILGAAVIFLLGVSAGRVHRIRIEA